MCVKQFPLYISISLCFKCLVSKDESSILKWTFAIYPKLQKMFSNIKFSGAHNQLRILIKVKKLIFHRMQILEIKRALI